MICLFLFVVFQIYSAVEETLGAGFGGDTWRTQNTGHRKSTFLILSVSVSEFDVMVLGMITVAATAATSLLTVYCLGKGSGGSDFGEEVITNSTIESEEKKNVSKWFDFENGNIALLSILAC